jgi:GTP-binding protein HflX
MLFATLDPTMRAVTLPGGQKAIFSDTVGFISDLPTQLVAAFRATLEEVLEADLILHVRDIAHADTEEQAAEVAKILGDLGAGAEVPVFEVWNKTDLLAPEARAAQRAEAARKEHVFPLSALSGEGMEALLDAVTAALGHDRIAEEVTLPFAEGKRRAWLFAEGVVEAERETEEGHRLALRWTPAQKARFEVME